MIGKYRLEVTYHPSHDLDEEIRELVGRSDWASGQGSDGRAMSFAFKGPKVRDAAKKKLDNAELPTVTTMACDAEGD